jgi:hypothetical protein
MSYSPHEEEHLCEDGVRRKIIIEQDECGDRDDPLKEEDTWCEFVVIEESRSTHGHKQVERDWLEPDEHGNVPYLDGGQDGYFEDQKPIWVMDVYMHGDELSAGDPCVRGERGEWGRSQIGWIWVDAAGYKTWSGEEWVSTKKTRAQLTKVFESIIDNYSHWCNGDVWGYRIQKLVGCVESCTCGRDPTWEEDDDNLGCWGFVGDWDECGIVDEARLAIGVPVEKKEPKPPEPEPQWRRQLHLIRKGPKR